MKELTQVLDNYVITPTNTTNKMIDVDYIHGTSSTRCYQGTIRWTQAFGVCNRLGIFQVMLFIKECTLSQSIL